MFTVLFTVLVLRYDCQIAYSHYIFSICVGASRRWESLFFPAVKPAPSAERFFLTIMGRHEIMDMAGQGLTASQQLTDTSDIWSGVVGIPVIQGHRWVNTDNESAMSNRCFDRRRE